MAYVFRGPKDLGSCFKRTNGSRSWLMLSKPRIFGPWLMFLEDQKFWILAHVFGGLRIFGLWLIFSEDPRFWILAHIFRGPRIFVLWIMFSKDQRF